MSVFSFKYESMGTWWEITIWYKCDSGENNNVISKLRLIETDIINMSNDFDNMYSRFKKDSLINKLSSFTGKTELPDDLVEMLKQYRSLYEVSNKKLNPLVGNMLSDMGYDANYSLTPKSMIREAPDFNETLKFIDEKTVEISKPVLIDLGALGKGYFVDKIARFLERNLNQNEYERFLVNGSGDIYYKGNGAHIIVGLEHPGDTTKIIGTFNMRDGSMCSSSIARRNWGKYNHIVDPVTKKSTEEIIASWIISDSASLSDALATCVFFVEPESLKGKYDFEYLLLNRDYKVKRSEKFKAELY